LNEQHDWLIDQLGFRIHPMIPVPNAEEGALRIADIACGTGVWLLDLAKQYPQAQLDGFDIDAVGFPATRGQEDHHRVNFHLADALAESGFGSKFESKFDIVQIRLVYLALKGSEMWVRMASNAAALLKPGGYLQWIEEHAQDLKVVQRKPGVKRAAIDQIFQ
ncbi:hypothetical protein BAUCODRAFT_54869, partial [Baudoinia panamericana UAMH 10762]